MSTVTEIALSPAMHGINQAKYILNRLFRDFDGGIRIHLWDGSEILLGRDHPTFSLTFRSAKAFQELVLSRDPLCLAESYFQGRIDIDGDYYHALKLRHYLTSLKLSLIEKSAIAGNALRIKPDKIASTGSDTPKWVKTLAQRLGASSSKKLNHDAISFHYDVSNDFYALWLDEKMIYSCAYYEDEGQRLEQAQSNKLDYICRKLRLKPSGLFLNHGITSDKGGWKKSVVTEFLNRYVFPDAQLETVSTVQQVMEDAGFEIHDVESLRQHYALTLREWVSRLELRHEEALQHVPESVYRIWRLYMAACALQFEEGDAGIYQILASRRAAFSRPVPLTRRDLYDQPR